ncbi:vesicle-associated membrane protein 724-like [Rutidosis leptorrhynchoides]|uniref:vesicle-associated membrane protein 724-like n=1 Tax=Rutidosis leptorrhynchoides TaxID=125765 RepID=UPI003A9A389C
MSQDSFVYSFVARGTTKLAEYTEFNGNFGAIATQCLEKLPISNNKFIYKCDHHIFNFLVEDSYAYCVVANESVLNNGISIALLERIKKDFKQRYMGGKADTAVPNSLDKEFGPIMKEHMKYIVEHAAEIDQILKVKAQVSEVKSVMLEVVDNTKKFSWRHVSEVGERESIGDIKVKMVRNSAWGHEGKDGEIVEGIMDTQLMFLKFVKICI